jgi:hypothetical protein
MQCIVTSKHVMALEYKGEKVASRSQKSSGSTIYVKKDFLYLPEIDEILYQSKYFTINTTDVNAIKYRDFVPNGYSSNYTVPNDLWLAWIGSIHSGQKSPIINLNGKWERIQKMSFYRLNYGLVTKDENLISSHAFVLWAAPETSDLKIEDNLALLSSDLSASVITQEKMWEIIKALEFKITERDLLLKQEIDRDKEYLKQKQADQKENHRAMSRSLALVKKEISRVPGNKEISGVDLVTITNRVQEAIDTCNNIFRH